MGESPSGSRPSAAGEDAFRRLLADAAAGGQAKVDAVVALAQRTVYVVTWPTTHEGFRTLVSAQGVAGLPIFTNAEQLEEASRRYGWMNPDGSLPLREIGAREAFSHAVAHNLVVVVDITADYSIELEPTEVAPLLTPQGRRDSSGPFAGAGRISSSLLQAVRTTPSAGLPQARQSVPITPPAGLVPAAVPAVVQSTPQAGRPQSSTSTPVGRGPTVGRAPSSTGTPVAAVPPPGRTSASASFGGVTGVVIARLASLPSDDLLDSMTDLLRGFPEVEWACIAAVARGPTQPVPTIGLRVDSGFRTRVAEIVQGLRDAASAAGASLDVFLLDDPALIRTARTEATMFYPWRK